MNCYSEYDRNATEKLKSVIGGARVNTHYSKLDTYAMHVAVLAIHVSFDEYCLLVAVVVIAVISIAVSVLVLSLLLEFAQIFMLFAISCSILFVL